MIELAIIAGWLISSTFLGITLRLYITYSGMGWSSSTSLTVIVLGVIGVSGVIGALLYWLRYVNLGEAEKLILPPTFKWLPVASFPGLVVGLIIGQIMVSGVRDEHIEIVNRVCTTLLCEPGADGQIDMSICDPESATYRACEREASDCVRQAAVVLDEPAEQEQWALDCTTSRVNH